MFAQVFNKVLRKYFPIFSKRKYNVYKTYQYSKDKQNKTIFVCVVRMYLCVCAYKNVYRLLVFNLLRSVAEGTLAGPPSDIATANWHWRISITCN